MDHAVTFLVSKNRTCSFRFHVAEFLIRRAHTSGVDKNPQMNLAFAHTIYGILELTGEIYRETRLNQTTPGFLSSPWALTYTATPLLVIDGGEIGLTAGGPRRHLFRWYDVLDCESLSSMVTTVIEAAQPNEVGKSDYRTGRVPL